MQHQLQLDGGTRKDVRNRLLSLRGHLDGVLKMLESDQCPYCVDVLKQIKAVQGALGRVSEMILRSHLRDHVVTAHERGDVDRIVEELMEVLKYRS
jgi:DNA-binding FrmR family transcriptional regulator